MTLSSFELSELKLLQRNAIGILCYAKVTCVLVLSCLLASCQSGEKTSERLLQAEACMEYASDSALAILQEVPQPELLQGENQALYALLLTQAMDKNDSPFVSDSLIVIAIDHYQEKKDNTHLALAFYYAACIYKEMQNLEQATIYFLKSRQHAEQIHEYKLLARISQQLSRIYALNDLKQDQKIEIFNLCKYAALASDSLYMAHGLEELGLYYMYTHQIDSAFYYYQKALIEAPVGEEQFRLTVLDGINLVHEAQHNYTKVITSCDSILSLNPSTWLQHSCWLNKGNMYVLQAQPDSAFHYYSLVKNSNYTTLYDNILVSKGLSNAYQLCGEHVKALKMYEQMSIYQDSLSEQMQAQEVLRTKSIFHLNTLKEKYLKEKNAKQQIQLVSMVILFLFLILIIFLYFSFRLKQRLQKSKLDKALAEFSQMKIKEHQWMIEREFIIATLEKEKDREQHEKDSFIESLETVNEKLLAQRKQINQTTFFLCFPELVENRAKGEEKELSKFCITDERWKSIYYIINKVYSDSISFLESHPDIDQDDVRLYCMLKLGVTIRELAVYYNLSTSAIYKKKDRLLQGKMGLPKNSILDPF